MEEKKPRKVNAIVLKKAELAPGQKRLIAQETPQEFIKTRKGKGGKSFRYIEGGYVIARLNEIFSPLGWDFEIVNERVEEKEVIVRGRILIKDPTGTLEIGKSQYGCKDRLPNVPLGDTLKSAATDCLKKCASLLGIALDVYWNEIDDQTRAAIKGKGKKGKVVDTTATPATEDITQKAITMINSQTDPTVLRAWEKKVKESSMYDEAQKQKVLAAIEAKLKKVG